MQDWANFRPNLQIFGVPQNDPGWIYLIRNAALFKIGKSRNPKKRIREALTWNPNIKIIAVKPFWNISYIERTLHEGLADCWHKGEWFCLHDSYTRAFITEGLRGFYEKDRDANSVDFIYWYNGSGMIEYRAERSSRRVSLRQFQIGLRQQQSDIKAHLATRNEDR
jgi:hypothetical protein